MAGEISRVKSNVVDEMPAESDHEKQQELALLYPDDIVKIEPSDPEHPLNWSIQKKLIHTLSFGFCTLSAQFSATVISPGVEELAREFHVGTEIGVLAMSIYVLGNGVGPMLFAPVSEVYGRKVGVFIPYFFSAVCTLVVANVESIAAVVVFRFLAGILAAAPIVTSGGAMADMWPATQRAAALVLYGGCIVAGSAFAPIFGALIIDNSGDYGWRWTCWLGGLLGLTISVTNFIFLSEPYAPVLAQRRAKNLRIDTGRWSLHAKHDEWRFNFDEFVHVHMARPILMFLTPIIFLMASYASFVYGIMFLIITSIGDNFQSVKHFNRVTSYLPLMCNFFGFVIGGLMNLMNSRRYAAKVKAGTAQPEDRLVAMMMFGWILPAGCFVYAWTLREDIHWIVPCIGIGMIGMGIAVIFQGALVYIVDAYTRFAASGIAANTFLRSIYGGVFPLFATQLYARLGVHWGSSLVGFLGLLMTPIPFVFYMYGARLRKINPYEKKLT